MGSKNTEPVKEIDLRDVAKQMEMTVAKDSGVVDSIKLKKAGGKILKLTIKGLEKTWDPVKQNYKESPMRSLKN